MPFSAKEEEQIRKTVSDVENIKRDIENLKRAERDRESAAARHIDTLTHEWRAMLGSAEKIFEGQVNALRPTLDEIEARGHQTLVINREQNELIHEMRSEMGEARKERERRRGEELAQERLKAEAAQLEAALEKDRVRRKEDREHRLKVIGAITLLLGAVGGLIALFVHH